MNDLASIANVAEILGALVVVGGVIFAVLQIREFRRQRLELATIEVVRTYQSPDFNRSYRLMQAIPDSFSVHDMATLEPEKQDAALVVASTFESIGVLVNRRVVSLDLIGELMGGSIHTAWAKMEPFAVQLRETTARPSVFEWFQWLAERLGEQGYFDEEPAYIQHAGWKPGSH